VSFRYEILRETGHRPWPMPGSPWIMTQTWHDLLFAHWPVDPGRVRARVPPELSLDVWDGRAWIGVVPFRMTNVAPRGVRLPAVVSAFPELNVRTYVTHREKPGVYFFSLDASSPLAVAGARTVFGLPYFVADMQVRRDGAGFEYRSRRRWSERPAEFDARYAPIAAPSSPAPGSFEHFLTERYCLYTVARRRRVKRLEIHHPPWPLQRAAAAIRTNSMADAAGIPLPAVAPVLHFSRRQDVVGWGTVNAEQ
jgi:uncharacterized protein YqjF (DUF2071 family)